MITVIIILSLLLLSSVVYGFNKFVAAKKEIDAAEAFYKKQAEEWKSAAEARTASAYKSMFLFMALFIAAIIVTVFFFFKYKKLRKLIPKGTLLSDYRKQM